LNPSSPLVSIFNHISHLSKIGHSLCG
jgi:hypothetical protein